MCMLWETVDMRPAPCGRAEALLEVREGQRMPRDRAFWVDVEKLTGDAAAVAGVRRQFRLRRRLG